MLIPAHESQPQRRLDAHRGFTLVEIILAISLAAILLLVGLTFYQQATEMRSQVLQETEKFSTLRLVLDQMAGDLRSAQPVALPGNEFSGDSNSLTFIKLSSLPPPSSLSWGTNINTDLVRITISTVMSTNGTNLEMIGLDRVESPLNPIAFSSLDGTNNSSLTNSLDATNITDLTDLAFDLMDDTNSIPEPFAKLVRFARFRYWDGTAWQLTWTNASPPTGVEIVLAASRMAEDADPEALPEDAFRRVVFLPAGITITDSNGNTNAASVVAGGP